ncbi:MAG: YvrJ family protein [Selenomonadaceae bacterium]|nr:YvrJ family protein [Selenomonadaceae bacterium]
MADYLNAVGNLGFPIAVTAFLLVRIEGKLGALNDSIQQLTQTIARKQGTGCDGTSP